MKIKPNGQAFEIFSKQSPIIAGQSGALSPLSLKKPDTVLPWETLDLAEKHRVRWHAERMPLSVSLQTDPSNTWPDTVVRPLLHMALAQWEAASLGALSFQMLQTLPSQADLQLFWADETVPGREYEVGHTDRKLQGQWLCQATVTLVTAPAIDARLSSGRRRQRLYSTLLHELGHAIGLEHSESAADVMHHRGWQNLCLSENDIRRVRALYPKRGGFIG
ncbi:MAG TPA: matrixin family metalloprotease [Oculatellaceae cyanobacterium]|jgi:hypothetical protein